MDLSTISAILMLIGSAMFIIGIAYGKKSDSFYSQGKLTEAYLFQLKRGTAEGWGSLIFLVSWVLLFWLVKTSA